MLCVASLLLFISKYKYFGSFYNLTKVRICTSTGIGCGSFLYSWCIRVMHKALNSSKLLQEA